MRLPFHLSSDLVLGLLLSVIAIVGYGWMRRPSSAPEFKMSVNLVRSSERAVSDEQPASRTHAESAASPELSLPVMKAAEVSEMVAVLPSTPGSSLHLNGQRVDVSGYQTASRSPGVGLSLLISPIVQPEANASEAGFESISQTPTSTPTDSPAPHGRRRGFTYEEELFRSKWGWAAFGQAQIATRESAADSGALDIPQRPR